MKHAVEALRASAQDTELTEHNVSVGVLSKDEPFALLAKDEVRVALGDQPAAAGDVEMVQA